MAAGNSLPAVHYVLTVEDAEAYERLPAEPGGWTKLLLVVSLAAVGGLYGFLDDQPAPVRIGIAAVAVIVWARSCGVCGSCGSPATRAPSPSGAAA